ncbi:esterase-like activity of phytase family protein [Amycolatopsis rhabdoformis]|uniref:Esterase-like activity of phytase family protein n=1 Tax=Amycolatopsis rhabdoformis TaxID=1448059 RepID=A0ABZ1I3W8_9PSEU|nr:esterase-like activity of phytase family protein [Amycolatopsis rhabdoformis]WSE28345.1 esterase-like activity of phytase family protein [Amycolatopsis rhabdoformis]
MSSSTRRRVLTAALVGALPLSLLAAPAAEAAPNSPNRPIRLIGEQIVPNALQFQGTTVGGLSSIDFDPRTGGYAFICDDRSAINPARFYTAKFSLDAHHLGPVTFTGTKPLLRPDGTPYPPLAQNDQSAPQNERTVDPEELRVDPWTGDYLWSQEGERTATTLIDPSIREAGRTGKYVRDLPIPADEKMTPGAGPRQNLVLEGLTYAGLGSVVASEVEGPLLQDGPLPTPEAGALSRLTLQSRFGPVLAQYAYPQEPVFAQSVPPTALGSNGVSSMLAVDPIDPTRYLMMERAFVPGVGNKVRIYEIDTSGATNVLNVKSLVDAKHVKPVKKKLLLDVADFGVSTVDNIEGMTWGPALPNGERSLVLVSDNNFSATQVTQVIALAVPSERL